jgi:transposase-like protein
MKEHVIFEDKNPFNPFNNNLEQILKEGAKRLLIQAIENEVNEYIESFKSLKDETKKRVVTRNGYLPERTIQTGLGKVFIKQPRVRDRREGKKFTSQILPPYLRRTSSLDALIPALYLKGISTGDMQEALEAILGENAKGLSATNIVRLKEGWERELKEWQGRDMKGKRYVYFWVDGIYFNVRLNEERPCLLVIIGALENGKKELVAIHDGIRESKLSWKEVLQDLKRRGLEYGPKLAIGDGALGFWAAIEEEFPGTRGQRCWVHKTANILDKMPKSIQANAKKMIHEIYMAPTKAEGFKAFDGFVRLYEAKYPKACDCLIKDKEALMAFYDFPAMHWQHIRTTNPIESTFATIRHRTRQTKGCGSRICTLTMVYKLATAAEKHWRKLKGHELIEKVIRGVKFKDGEEINEKTQVA